MGLVAVIRSWMVAILLLLLLLVEWGSQCHGCWAHERTALWQIKSSFNDYGVSRWGIDADCCTWAGVTCDGTTKRVTELDLSSAPDPGPGGWYLNASLFLPFKDLTSLDLGGNKILGCIENEGFDKLSKLAHLETLNLAGNEFNENLHYLTSVKRLHLAHNEIEGFKSFRGEDEEVLRLSSLHYVDLSFNNLDSSILSSLKGLSSIKRLNLRHNQLKGSIYMKELHALRRLEGLDLSGNEITRFVAARDNKSWSNCNVLYLVGIRRNSSHVLELQSLHSCFPNLKSLHLSSNNLQGTSFGSYHLNNLEELNLDDSTVDDNFLQSIGALVSLQNLSMVGLN